MVLGKALTKLGVLDEGAQGSHRAMGARIAESSFFPHAQGPGVIGMSKCQLGRRQDGNTVALGGHATGRRVAPILPLVKRHDSIESEIGIEGTRLEGSRLGGLNSNAQVDHRIDVGMCADQLEDRGDRVAPLTSRQVYRIDLAPACRDHLVDRRDDLGRKLDQLEYRC